MSRLLEYSLIRILNSSNLPVGMAFLGSNRTAMTCAHVIAQALGWREYPVEAPTDLISLDFPLLNPGQIIQARLLNWLPPEAQAGDIAVLELLAELPPAARSVPLIEAAQTQDLWDHSFRSWGVPTGHDQGVWAAGLLRAGVAGGWLQIEASQLTGYSVQPGFSGGPVWDDELNGVVGMVVATDTDPKARTAFVIPVAQLVQAHPPLDETTRPPCPYRGLFAFRRQDADLFFGRQDFIEQLTQAVQRKPLVAVVGPSGSGKSSVVFSGLLPQLKDSDWLVADLRPGSQPFDSLAAALLPLLEPGMSETDRLVELRKLSLALDSGNVRLTDVITRLLQKHACEHLLLVVDQFEELYTLCSKETLRQSFVDELLHSLETTGSITLLLTLRADFLGQALAYRPLADAFQQHKPEMIGPMNAAELEQAIEQPAAVYGVSFEPGLATRIRQDVQGRPGDLPLLEFALTQLWASQHARQLTHVGYETIGEVQGALACYADAVYQELPETEQQNARQLFVQLVTPGVGTEDTRRLATQSELGQPAWELAQKLATERLVVTGADPSAEQTAEVVHEALISYWGLLREWMDVDRQFRAWQERLRLNLHQWENSQFDQGALLHGAPLIEAEEWLKKRPHQIPEGEQNYIQCSIELRQQEVADKEAQLKHELQQTQQLSQTQRQRALILGIGLIATLILSAFVWGYYRQANTNLEIANIQGTQSANNAATAESESMRAAQNASTAQAAESKAISNAATAQAASTQAVDQQNLAKQQARLAHTGQLAAQAQNSEKDYSQRALLLAHQAITSLNTGDPRVPYAETVLRESLAQSGGMPLVGSTGGVTALSFSPDGRWLASGSGGGDNTLRLWDVADPQAEPLVLRGHEYAILALAFSPDGRWLASGSWGGDTTLFLWNIANPQAEPVKLLGQNTAILALAFSPDGRWLASGSGDINLYLWDMQSPQAEPLVLLGHESAINTIAFSPDGRWLASGSDDNTLRLWEMQSPQAEPLVLSGHEDTIYALAFSPDGRWLASGSWDATLRLWDMQSPQAEPLVLRGHEDAVFALAFSPDGRWLASGSDDTTLRLWDMQAPQAEQLVLRGHENGVHTLAFSPNGHWLASGSEDKTLRIWDMQAPQAEPLVLRGHENRVHTLVFSPDGRWLASGSDDDTLRFWDMQAPQAEPLVLRGHESEITTLAFSLDGRWLASGSEDATLHLWDMQAPQAEPIVLRGHNDVITTLTFSPDGRWLASSSGDATLRLWNMQALQAEPFVLRGHEYRINALAFSPDSRWLAFSSEDTSLRLWDLQAPQAEPLLLLEYECVFITLAFSPDGRWLASGSDDNTLRLWDMQALRAEPLVLREHEDLISTLAFSPEGRWLASGSWDASLRLWDMQAPQAEPLLLRENEFGDISLAFSPDGRWLASGSGDATLRIWDMQAPQAEPIVLRGHEELISTIAFSPDGRWLASGSWDATLRIWDMQVLQAEPIVLRGQKDIITTLAFSPDGRWLASGSGDATLRIWDMDLNSLLEKACFYAGRNLTPAEWAQFFPGEPYQKTCLQWP